MFKTSFDLPEPKKENGKLKNRKERKAQGNVGADDLQAMFKQLGRDKAEDAPEVIEQKQSTKPNANEEKTSKRPLDSGNDTKSSKKNKKSKTTAKDDSKDSKPEPKEPKETTEKVSKKANKKSKEEGSKKQTQQETASTIPPKPPASKAKLTPMQLKMQQKLSGGRFRWINEQLYTVPSEKAVDLFKKSPELFNEYHTGFRHQVESWPENPVDLMIKTFKERLQKPLAAPGGLPADKDGRVIVADMGCGEAQLALQVSKLKGSNKSKKVKFTVHSFDLHKANDRITVSDIAHTPLEDKSVHVVVYCLALMGTNTEDFIKEALRILKPFGEIWISEIKSRFDIVKDKTDTQRFVDKLKSYGLHHKQTDDSNKMFVSFQFVNIPKRENGNKQPKFIDQEEDDDAPLLKPCIYKRR